MFTGLVESTGTVSMISDSKKQEPSSHSGVTRLVIDCESFNCSLGDSVAINGCCLSVTDNQSKTLSFDISQETLALTNLSLLKVGDSLNLERAMKLNDRLGGHLVSGHIDTIGTVKHLHSSQDAWTIRLNFSKEWAKLVIFKGSICVNGVSLTINSVVDSIDSCEVSMCLIPITVAETNLSELTEGAPVNLEFDMLGKYMMRQTELAKP